MKMELSNFFNFHHEVEGTSLKELQKLLETTSKQLDDTLKFGCPDKFTGEPAWNDVQVQLEELKMKISATTTVIENYLKDIPQARRRSVAMIYDNPMLIPTPPAFEFSSENGRKMFENMSPNMLYKHIMKENTEPMTKEMRKEIEAYLRRTFPCDVVHPSVINRVLLINHFQLASCQLHLEAWLSAKSPRQFKWKPIGEDKFRVCRMTFDYECEEMKKSQKAKSPTKPLKTGVPSKMSMSLPLILELQYLHIWKQLSA